MENLIKTATWYNPYTVITDKGNGYEIENIKIYSENGIIMETGRGWFESNNHLGDKEIGTIYLRKKLDLTKKENFIIKEEKKSYTIDHRYTLYIYYKDINCNFKKFDLSTFWIESVFEIFDGYEIRDVLGQRRKESDAIKYGSKLDDLQKVFDSYHFEHHYDEIEAAMKEIKKQHKKYLEKKAEEDAYTIKDYKKMLFTPDEATQPEEMIHNIEKTFNVNIMEMGEK